MKGKNNNYVQSHHISRGAYSAMHIPKLIYRNQYNNEENLSV